MKQHTTLSSRQLVLAALMSALTVVASSIRITLPLEIAGTTSFHLGNILCALCGILLGPWMGGLASGLGSAIYDMLNPLYISEAWITFLFKGAYGLCSGLVARTGKKEWGHIRATAASAAGALTYALLYLAKSYFYNGRFLSGLTPGAAALALVNKLPATAFNAAVAIIFAPILALAIREALKQNRLSMS